MSPNCCARKGPPSKELPYLLGTPEVAYGAAVAGKDRTMADIFMGNIAAFARTGDPNRSGLPAWPRYDAAKSELMMLTPDAAAIVQADPWQARLDLIERPVEAQAARPQ
jgi:para-nitrobenzyl esterase